MAKATNFCVALAVIAAVFVLVILAIDCFIAWWIS